MVDLGAAVGDRGSFDLRDDGLLSEEVWSEGRDPGVELGV
jgi:hypothetical protein